MSTIVLLLLILVFFIYTLFFCKGDRTQYLSINQTTAIKGWAIIITYIHHFGQIRSEIYINHSFLGYLGVALFFFLSGYVTEMQTNKKEGELWKYKFWEKKVIRIIIPKLIVVFAFGFVAGRTISDNCIEFICFWKDWFLTAILINFALFYFAKCFHWHLLKTIFLGELVLVIVCIGTDQMIAWYNTAFLFGLGVWFYSNQKRVVDFFDNRWKLWSSVVICCGTLFCSIMRYQRFVFDTITGILFTFIFFYFVYQTNFESKSLSFVGKYSWEFYLIHARVIGIVLNRFTTDNLWAFIISFIISLIIAIGVNLVVNVCFNQKNRKDLLRKAIAVWREK